MYYSTLMYRSILYAENIVVVQLIKMYYCTYDTLLYYQDTLLYYQDTLLYYQDILMYNGDLPWYMAVLLKFI